MSNARTKLQAVLFVGLLVCASLALLLTFTSVPSAGKYTYALNSFKSYDDLLAFLRQRASTAGDREALYTSKNTLDGAATGNVAVPQSTATSSPSHSSTNVQVAGVDEPDTVKTDGTYIYTLSNNTIFILQAYPATDAAIVGRITLDENHSAQSFFVNGDRLIVFCSGGFYYPVLYDGVMKTTESLNRPWYGNSGEMSILVYDLGDRASPSLSKEVKMDGYFSDARMIGSYVYVVSTTPTYMIYSEQNGNETLRVPTITIDGQSQNITPNDIYYVDVPELADSMTHVLSLNLDTSEVNDKSFMLGSSQTMYVSQNNIYLATSHWPVVPLAADNTASSSDTETTVLHKIAINASSIDYVAQGEVPGHILNQFAMDEYNGYFRIATTEGYYNGDTYQTTNNVYILDANLKEVSSLKNIAPGESIYAVRFLGDRAYLVTFVEIDPLFALDLSDPQNPQILGELKIPGYSTYLHPYDETHIIGIGRDVNRSIDADKIHTPGAVYYTAVQGLKLALFDVSDITNPVEEASVTIGDRGTDSPALYDHHAFLFDREKNLLVIPVSLYEIPQKTLSTLNDSNATELLPDWGQFTFQGAYVYHLTIENGFQLQGRITHQDDTQPTNDWYWGYSNTDITRSLYIGNILYTVSQSKVKANSLDDLQELASIRLA